MLPEHVTLLDTQKSDDLQFIEQGLNAVLEEMRVRIKLAEEVHCVECELRKTIESQQKALIHAERHRTMVQGLGAASHHIGQPATVLKMRLYLLKQMATSMDQVAEIEECEKDIRAIIAIIEKLRAVNEFKAETYINGESFDDLKILSI